MSDKAEAALAIFKSIEGLEEGVGDWFEVDQARINLFADATMDHQFIHIDPEKSAELSPLQGDHCARVFNAEFDCAPWGFGTHSET